MKEVIDAAIKNKIAIEINNRFKIPSEKFIALAKNSGAKFTIGTNNVDSNFGRAEYALEMIRKCGLTEKDFWKPPKKNSGNFPSFTQYVKVVNVEKERKVDIFVNEKLFTSFIYPVNLEKPVLYPVYAPDGTLITRGYPILPRKGERADHPHQVGMWFTHENVNGLDFWNNSFAIKKEDKSKYGHIVVDKILKAESGSKGILEVLCGWNDNSGKRILTEDVKFIFMGDMNRWNIDRISTLSATDQDVTITDCKDGMFAIRVDRAFEMPSNEPLVLIGENGEETGKKVIDNSNVTGMYISSNGKSGDAVWGTRNRWVILSGNKNNQPISMAIFDNPSNTGFPAYFHARGYGLFSVNNFGRKSYDPSQEKFIQTILKGQSVKLVHKFCVQAGSLMTPADADKIFERFSKEYK